MRTVERAIVEAIVTAVPMIDSTIEWSTLPLTVVPPLIRHHLPPGTDGFKQLRQIVLVIDGTLLQVRISRISPSRA